MCSIVPCMPITRFESWRRLEGWATRMKACKWNLLLLVICWYILNTYTALTINANFYLKQRHVSSEAADPSFSNSWSYFVPELDYKSYLAVVSNLIIQKASHIISWEVGNSDIHFSLVPAPITIQSMPNDWQRAWQQQVLVWLTVGGMIWNVHLQF